MARDTSMAHLHPVFRVRLQAVVGRLAHTPLRLFEGYRSPRRQRQLFAQGRTVFPGKKVTDADAWQSYHQYGLAADLVPFIEDNWTWAPQGAHASLWRTLHKVAAQEGLQWLSWEQPHLQLPGLELRKLMSGDYPAGGDCEWAENLDAEIEEWQGRPRAPQHPSGGPHRPPLAPHGPSSPSITHGGERVRVIARNGLRVRSGPGADWSAVGVLAYGQEVQVLGGDEQWAMVDIGFDGRADGYCHRGYLQ